MDVTELGAPDLSGIAVIGTTEYFPWLSSGGTDHVAWQVARRLVSYGASFTMVAGIPADRRPTTVDPIVDGVHTVALPTIDIGRRIGAELAAPRGAKDAIDRARSVGGRMAFYASGLHFPISLSLVRAANATRTPLVTTCHVGHVPLPTWPLRLATRVYEASAGRWMLRSSDEVVAVSEGVRNHIAPLLGGTPVTVVPNGVDLDRFAASQFADQPRVVFVGRLIANKGPGELVEALGELSASGECPEAIFIGDGQQRSTLEARTRELGIADRVQFAGHVEDVEAHLRSGDIFVRPSLSEGMPLALLEAMAAGCCAVATNVAGNSELVGNDERGLLVPVDDRGALVAALRRLLADRGLRERLSTAAIAESKKHSWDATGKASAHVILRALQNSRP